MRWFEQVRQLWCRHEDILRLDHGRMWLECLACGRATRGFDGLGRAVRVGAAAHETQQADWRARILDRAA